MTASQAAKQILAEMGGDAQEICTGECTTFAKAMVNLLGRGEIVSNLTASMLDELDGYTVIEPEDNMSRFGSHCWVSVDGKFYDAFDPQGVEFETDMEWIEQI